MTILPCNKFVINLIAAIIIRLLNGFLDLSHEGSSSLEVETLGESFESRSSTFTMDNLTSNLLQYAADV